jgi:hypothetical protein
MIGPIFFMLTVVFYVAEGYGKKGGINELGKMWNTRTILTVSLLR